MKEHGKNLKDQTNEEEISSLHEKNSGYSKDNLKSWK